MKAIDTDESNSLSLDELNAAVASLQTAGGEQAAARGEQASAGEAAARGEQASAGEAAEATGSAEGRPKTLERAKTLNIASAKEAKEMLDGWQVMPPIRQV